MGAEAVLPYARKRTRNAGREWMKITVAEERRKKARKTVGRNIWWFG